MAHRFWARGRNSLLCRSSLLCPLLLLRRLLTLPLLPPARCLRLALLSRRHTRSVGCQAGGVRTLVQLSDHQASLGLMPHCCPVLVLHTLHWAVPLGPSCAAAGGCCCCRRVGSSTSSSSMAHCRHC
jgi:hypothetical protein